MSPDTGRPNTSPNARPSTFSVTRLRRRADFLKAARGRRAAMPGLVLQMRVREAAADAPLRVGFTVTRKVGNAVTRNRAKRRLRAAAAAVLPRYGLPGRDYVVIGRAGTLTRPFALLVADFERALAKVQTASPGTSDRRPAPVSRHP